MKSTYAVLFIVILIAITMAVRSVVVSPESAAAGRAHMEDVEILKGTEKMELTALIGSGIRSGADARRFKELKERAAALRAQE